MIISMKQACELTSLSRSSINEKREAGTFPVAVELGEKRIGFVKSEVENWIDARIAARSTEQAGRTS